MRTHATVCFRKTMGQRIGTRPGSESGQLAMLTFEPLLPPIAWVTLAIAAVVVWGLYAVRRPSVCGRGLWTAIMGLTAAGIGAVLLVLLNPIRLEALPPPAGKPLLTILIDKSASMAMRDTDDETSRFAKATESAAAFTNDRDSPFEIRVMSFSDEVQPAAVEQLAESQPDGESTNIATALLDALVADRPQGQAVLMISDGIHNVGSSVDATLEAAETARAWDVPVYTATTGGTVQVDDLEVHVPRSQELAFVGQSVPVAVELRQRGRLGDSVQLTLDDSSQSLTTQTATIAADGTTESTFLVTPSSTGLFQYRVTAEALPGETTTANNSTAFQVRVVDQPVRALVLEGKPYWDARFLMRMLTDDPSLEVDAIVRVSDDRYLWRKLQLVDSVGDTVETDSPDDSSKTVDSPSNSAGIQERRFERTESLEFLADGSNVLTDPELLRNYQILLLGREAETYLNDLTIENIRNWIARQGGSLVCYRGSPVAEPDQKLSRLLPVRWAGGRNIGNESRFRVQVTERGDDLNWLRIGGSDGLSKLPSLATSPPADSLKPLAVVLGRGGSGSDTSPVLTYQPYGTGRVVVVEGSGMWRWAFLPPEYREMDSVYATLWQSLLRWLISTGGLLPGEDIALQMDQVRFTEGESISAVVLRRPELDVKELPTVSVFDDNNSLLQSVRPLPVGDEPGVYQVFIGVLPAGDFSARLELAESESTSSKEVHFSVRKDLRERLEVSSRPDLMKRIAEISGGSVISANDVSGLTKSFEDHVQAGRPVQYQRWTAWDRWWVLAGVLVLWTGSWGFRRRTGLI